MSADCTIKCDTCQERLPDGPYKSVAEARKTARGVGWHCGRHDICPDCRAEMEGEKQ